jgi:nucleotide-binding universal stress UspA family protein
VRSRTDAVVPAQCDSERHEDGAAARHHRRLLNPEREHVMKLIVHATDGSDEAAEALEFAIDLARETGAAIATVAIHTVHGGQHGRGPALSPVEQPDRVQGVADAAAETARAAGVAAEAHVGGGDAAKEIARIAEELGADLIVVGSRGFGAIHGALVGSVSRALMAKSAVPVTVVTNRGVRETANV